mmetsp:Transcript_46926/g.150840  ORF Transcript_46926/g.150840 Transcript_46926/m.150840 type:complete len:103 (+) Transcript_46926:207-515(+)
MNLCPLKLNESQSQAPQSDEGPMMLRKEGTRAGGDAIKPLEINDTLLKSRSMLTYGAIEAQCQTSRVCIHDDVVGNLLWVIAVPTWTRHANGACLIFSRFRL